MIEYPELEQGSPEWLQARCGVITASVIGQLVTREQPSPYEFDCADCGSKAGDPCMSKTRKEPTPVKVVHPARVSVATAAPPQLVTAQTDTSRNLLLTIAAERITGHVEDVFKSADMIRGTQEEPFARDAYAANYGEVVELGFCTEDKWGFTIGVSPDGLVGDDGGIEIKSRRAKTHVEIVLAGEVPERHMAQIQTALLVTGRKWWDYIDFSNGMHLFVERVLPDQQWFDAITDAVKAGEEYIADIIAAYEEACANLPATERIIELEDMRIA